MRRQGVGQPVELRQGIGPAAHLHAAVAQGRELQAQRRIDARDDQLQRGDLALRLGGQVSRWLAQRCRRAGHFRAAPAREPCQRGQRHASQHGGGDHARAPAAAHRGLRERRDGGLDLDSGLGRR